MPAVTPRRRPAITVLDVDAVRFDDHARTALGQLVAPGPMRRGVIAVKEPGGRKHEGTGANRRDPPGAASDAGQLVHYLVVRRGAARAETADDQERVKRA